MPYAPHEVFEPPRPNARLLRYMNFTKFVSMLDTKALYFTRVDRLGDRFEGSMSRTNLRARDAKDTRVIDAGRPELLRQWEQMRRWMPQQTFVNCWTRSGYESVAMWRMYVGDGNGVAIESNLRRLTESIHQEPRPVFIGQVKYIDFDRDFIPEDNAMHPFTRKRRSFEYEKEVRALTSTMFAGIDGADVGVTDEAASSTKREPVPVPPPASGLLVPSDLERLVRRVRVSPVSPSWFTELVDSVIRRYGFTFAVTQSDIDGEPVY